MLGYALILAGVIGLAIAFPWLWLVYLIVIGLTAWRFEGH